MPLQTFGATGDELVGGSLDMRSDIPDEYEAAGASGAQPMMQSPHEDGNAQQMVNVGTELDLIAAGSSDRGPE